MLLDLRAVVEQPGASAPFSRTIDLTEMSFPFGKPFGKPIDAKGQVKNTAGLLELEAVLETTMSLVCDRCAAPFERDMRLPVSLCLSLSPTVEDDDILPIVDDMLDLDEALIPCLVLSMETKHLCREDCRGLCHVCWRNLNESECGCTTPVPILTPEF